MQYFYRWRYYVWHPHEWIADTYRNVKYAYQRVVRGWDDRVLWSIDHWLVDIMPTILSQFAKNAQSYPGGDMTFEKWRKALYMMAEGFEAGGKLANHETMAWDMLWDEWDKRYPDKRTHYTTPCESRFGGEECYEMHTSPEYDALQLEMNYQENHDNEVAEQQRVFDRGMRFFHEWFFHLWS